MSARELTATLGKLQYMVATHRSTHAISGTFGSAASALHGGLSAQQCAGSLYTAQSASGLASWQRDTQHIEKSFDFGGMPARNGITAALLVQAGGTALDDIFSGADNFLEALQPMNDPGMLIEALGERYEIMRTDVKKWTVGAPIQAPLDAMANLMQKNRFTADQYRRSPCASPPMKPLSWTIARSRHLAAAPDGGHAGGQDGYLQNGA